MTSKPLWGICFEIVLSYVLAFEQRHFLTHLFIFIFFFQTASFEVSFQNDFQEVLVLQYSVISILLSNHPPSPPPSLLLWARYYCTDVAWRLYSWLIEVVCLFWLERWMDDDRSWFMLHDQVVLLSSQIVTMWYLMHITETVINKLIN